MPVYIAARAGSVEVLEWLTNQGAAPLNDCRELNLAPLRSAAANNRIRVLNWLDARGAASVDDCRRGGLVFDAAARNNTQVLEWLALNELDGTDFAIAGARAWAWWRASAWPQNR
jgi:hypothetical protein